MNYEARQIVKALRTSADIQSEKRDIYGIPDIMRQAADLIEARTKQADEKALAAALRLLINSTGGNSMEREVALKAARETLNKYDMRELQL